jgi:hypothetical protein
MTFGAGSVRIGGMQAGGIVRGHIMTIKTDGCERVIQKPLIV